MWGYYQSRDFRRFSSISPPAGGLCSWIWRVKSSKPSGACTAMHWRSSPTTESFPVHMKSTNSWGSSILRGGCAVLASSPYSLVKMWRTWGNSSDKNLQVHKYGKAKHITKNLLKLSPKGQPSNASIPININYIRRAARRWTKNTIKELGASAWSMIRDLMQCVSM